METIIYKVHQIDGEYAHLQRIDEIDGELKLVARAFLPQDILEGSSLKYEMFEYTMLE